MKTVHTTCDFGDQPAGRVDRVVQELTGLSRARVRGLFDHGCVHVNDSVCTDSAARAGAGDRVSVTYEPNRRYAERSRTWHDPAFEILHEDEHLLVVNKSAHVLTVPANNRQTNTLVHALERYLAARGAVRGRSAKSRASIHVVQRLDLGVSGVMVFAKSRTAADKLKDQFAGRKPQRVYIAIVQGELDRPRGTFQSHLATDAGLSRYSTRAKGKGELAITHFETERTAHGATLVRVKLETGRRNQIRVHFAEAGHPVLGDPRYPREQPGSAKHPRWKGRRIALHAASLGLKHPATGKPLHFESALPGEFVRFFGAAE